jgi:nitrite reductase (NO-forming)/hydroxylamine reductase
MTTRNWENYFGVILRDAGQVAILDGDTFELVTIVPTGFAVHILRASTTGRYFYAIGRDGRVTLIDLWTPTPTIDAVVQGCSDARSVESSRFAGFEDRLVIEGCYWPPQYVVFDGATLEPRGMQSVLSDAITGEHLDEVRVASIVGSRFDPLWAVSLKESGYVGLVDYSQEGFPMVARIPTVRFLHDGGLDRTGRYFLISANASNRVAVVDLRERSFVTSFTTGIGPHPGRAANWLDPTYGWVNAVAHMGQGRLAVYGADPEGSPANAWRVVRNVSLPAAGSLFIKTHPDSPWVWIDAPVSTEPNAARRICVYSKARGVIERCWLASDHGQAVHFEYNRAGTQVWVSIWDRVGELVVYDDRTLTEVRRIRGEWLVTPTGKFNVYNTAHDVY